MIVNCPDPSTDWQRCFASALQGGGGGELCQRQRGRTLFGQSNPWAGGGRIFLETGFLNIQLWYALSFTSHWSFCASFTNKAQILSTCFFPMFNFKVLINFSGIFIFRQNSSFNTKGWQLPTRSWYLLLPAHSSRTSWGRTNIPTPWSTWEASGLWISLPWWTSSILERQTCTQKISIYFSNWLRSFN